MPELKYKRVLLKLSGEALAGSKGNGIDAKTVGEICDKIKEIVDLGVKVGIVVGGGNFWRGRNGHQMERTTADYMGMLATAMCRDNNIPLLVFGIADPQNIVRAVKGEKIGTIVS